ncbi:uncharacterized protein LOC135936667 [Cloeon dipterum]|uniref:uncharacterized protein LOC135936667 n=1 Tax=Cloeon dipterum TaxID=197152 RepID=UPI00321FD01E
MAEDAAALFALTERRLCRLEKRKHENLVELAALNIIQPNLSHSLVCLDAGHKLKNIPITLSAKHLLPKFTAQRCAKEEGDLEEFERRKLVLRLLLSPEVKHLEVDGLLSFCPKSLKRDKTEELVQVISDHASNLGALTIDERSNASLSCAIVISASPLMKLANLRSLTVKSCSISYEDLVQMCRKLDFLVNLDINIFFECNPSFKEFKKSFSKLKQFAFRIFSAMGRFQSQDLALEFWEMCIKSLPALTVIERFADKKDAGRLPPCRTLEKLPKRTSALEHLCTRPTLFKLHLSFPKVKHLMVDFQFWTYSERELDSLLHFADIESLVLILVPSLEILERFLDAYGRNLLYLFFKAHFDDEIGFKIIFEKCPILESLGLEDVCVSDKPLNAFSNLKNFEWKPCKSAENTSRLCNILKAPDLKNLVLKTFNFGDLADVTRLVKSGAILQKLKTLHIDHASDFSIYFLSSDHGERDFKAVFQVISNFIKVSSAHLPELSTVTAEFSFGSTKWDEIFTELDISPEKVDYFDCRYAAAFKILGDETLYKFLNLYKRRKFCFPA